VVYQKRQFSWTADETQARSSKNPEAVASLAQTLEKFMRNKSPENVVAELSELTGLPPKVTHYRKINGKYSPRSQKFFGTLVRVGEIGMHEFFITKSAAQGLERHTRTATHDR
jgi:hypothetical protein